MPVTPPAGQRSASSPDDELEQYAHQWAAEHDKPPWAFWLGAVAEAYCTAPMAAHHRELWDWLWAIEDGTHPTETFVAIWPRGGAKSTTAELGVVMCAARRTRRYVLYVSDTQDQADDHVASIASLLESDALALWYPELGQRLLSKFGSSRGWRRNRLRTATGFTVDALGLNKGARGVKFEDQRPDLIVFDDLDSEEDGPGEVERKVAAITRKLLPAGSDDLAVLAIQNLVHPDSIFAQLADGRADFLTARHVSGPVPAVRGLAVDETEPGRWTIVGGEPTWAGQDLDVCQQQITKWGISAFRAEAQHEVAAPPGGMYDHVAFAHCDPDDVPDLLRVVVWVDPAVTDTDRSDSHAIQADGVTPGGVIYRLFSWEARTSPEDSLERALTVGHRLGAQHVGVETDQGGDTWRSVYREAARRVAANLGVSPESLPRFTSAKAGSTQMSKAHRNARMLADYERPGRIVHVIGTHTVLETALRRFPRTKPFDLADAAFWGWRDLRGAGGMSRPASRQSLSARLPHVTGVA